MSETKAERAIRTLLEAADALDDIPANLRRHQALGLGVLLGTQQLRDEAAVIERLMAAYAVGAEPAGSIRSVPDVPQTEGVIVQANASPTTTGARVTRTAEEYPR